MQVEQNVSAVIINFQTPDLTGRAVRSFKKFYPSIPLLVIENGSNDNSVTALQTISNEIPPPVELIKNAVNIHHGPAMDQAVHHLQSKYILFLDSDCEVLTGSFLEAMVDITEGNTKIFAAGKRVFMNSRGFDSEEQPGTFQYIRPFCMLIRRELYLTLPPFEKHGAPCLATMKAAVANNYVLTDFPVLQYVRHEGRGTAGKFGYGLGVKGKVNHLLQKLGL